MTPGLERPSLSVGLERNAHRRLEPELLAGLLRDPRTVVLELDGDRAPVRDDGRGIRLALRPVSQTAWEAGLVVDDAAAPLVVYLGEDAQGGSHLLVAAPGTIGPGERLATLREVGGLLDDSDVGLLCTAMALANWHATHPRCSRCGAPTRVSAAGWARSCPACGGDHYPRTDPAVIMAVVDEAGRILLGHQAVWPPKRFSTLAGFVEPGETLEGAVRREVAEETAIEVGEVVYQGSQPWPFPTSLMLAFTAQARTTSIRVDGDELSQARWWTREELGLDVATDELLLPPPVSVARRLIEQWYGGPIRDGGRVWR